MDTSQREFSHKFLAVADIKSLCDDEIKFKRALQCLKGLQNRTLKIESSENDLKAECKCYGTSDNIYSLSIKLNRKLKCLSFAKCSCPYKTKFSREEKLCKHIISLLLKYFCYDFTDGRKGDVLLSPTTLPQSSTKCSDKESNSAHKKRHLPSWMNRDYQECGAEWPSSSKINHSIVSTRKQHRMRSKRQGSYIKRTVYLMTPSELLETAHDIVKNSKCAESLKTEITENAVEGVKKDTKSSIPDSITEDPSPKLYASVDKEKDESYIEVKVLPGTREILEKELNCSIRDDCHVSPDLRTVQTERGVKDIVSGRCSIDEYSILDELM